MIIESIENCYVAFNDRKKTLKDKKGRNSKYLIENCKLEEFHQIDIEECVYKNNSQDTKCDFAIKTSHSVFFIELKGSNVTKGVNQLLETIKETKHCFQNLQLNARLIVSKFSKPDLVRQRKEYVELAKLVKYKEGKNKNLIIKQNIYTEVL